MKKILVTGASGFIGKTLCNKLIKLSFNVQGAVRSLDSLTFDYNFKAVTVGEIGANTNWINALKVRARGLLGRTVIRESEIRKPFKHDRNP